MNRNFHLTLFSKRTFECFAPKSCNLFWGGIFIPSLKVSSQYFKSIDVSRWLFMNTVICESRGLGIITSIEAHNVLLFICFHSRNPFVKVKCHFSLMVGVLFWSEALLVTSFGILHASELLYMRPHCLVHIPKPHKNQIKQLLTGGF